MGVEKVEREDHGWLHVSSIIIMTNPMLLKSIVYIINLASNEHYAPFLEKSIMIANNTDEGSENNDESFPEQKRQQQGI